jgi:hypothetical protein
MPMNLLDLIDSGELTGNIADHKVTDAASSISA